MDAFWTPALSVQLLPGSQALDGFIWYDYLQFHAGRHKPAHPVWAFECIVRAVLLYIILELITATLPQ